ncbi:hypothetical protein GCM10009122_32950 [Fulvivirga kasyanovii]|jgi:hypothetical protein|uniref:Uncharacterized protein n=3 Tax=Cytophagales TaxID=768507 RepID=A0ABQ1MCM6_9BACT|nr:hypothetical protein [Fulvivirga kasyanovii]MTI27797.1 hypothetical protein [Fulvivirga kasyanovii]WKN35984.1 hypothetical protein K4G66_26825 [Tunicatimonas sp. TK19036]GGC36399.1 hypothetical protein GCM10011506_22220 [Marivirga lumbricoides]HNP17007.1 hypothetical protein [Fulvivirga sp.]
MIRKVIQQMTLEGEAAEKLLIKRHFVPVEFSITENGQYKTFKEKVPHSSCKVVGVIITHGAPDQKIHHNRVYVGSAQDTYINQALVCGLRDDLIGSQPVVYRIEVKEGEKLYYAQPKRLEMAELKLNDQKDKFKDPVTVEIRDFWTDFKEDYWVWESKYAGLGMVKLEVHPAPENYGDGGINDDEEDDY